MNLSAVNNADPVQPKPVAQPQNSSDDESVWLRVKVKSTTHAHIKAMAALRRTDMGQIVDNLYHTSKESIK
ncbi:MAG: hypothetical protein AAF267_03455 [Deinococcota bacterium]